MKRKQYITPTMKVVTLDLEDCCCQLTVGSPTTTSSDMLVKGKRWEDADLWNVKVEIPADNSDWEEDW